MGTFNLGFTRQEILGVGAILLGVFLVSFINFQTAAVKARDEQRKANARRVVDALEAYHKDFGKFPPAKDGKIVACGTQNDLRPCEWGIDKLADVRDSDYPAYLDPLPYDPRQGQGISMFYLSNGSDFQLFTSLERSVDGEYSQFVHSLGIVCGRKVCNYGISTSRKPVNTRLENVLYN